MWFGLSKTDSCLRAAVRTALRDTTLVNISVRSQGFKGFFHSYKKRNSIAPHGRTVFAVHNRCLIGVFSRIPSLSRA